MLDEAQCYWQSSADFRLRRERCKRYCYGDQWGDQVLVDGKWVREEQYIRSMGSEPLKNNLIRRLVKQVLGLYRREVGESGLFDTQKLFPDSQILADDYGRMLRLNDMEELNARALEEFLISGMAVQRKSFGVRHGMRGCFTDNVSPSRLIIDSNFHDPRGWDMKCVGEIHDLGFDTLCAEFAHDEADYARLAEIYNPVTYGERLAQILGHFGGARSDVMAFRSPSSASSCRVYELWRRERRPGYLCHDVARGELFWTDASTAPLVECVNVHRLSGIASGEGRRWPLPIVRMQWMMADEWRYYFLSPFGDVLDEGVSPYAHRGHPYVLRAYPFVDGEIHSFVDDVIDQQRYTNRLITLYDWVMRSSAKGVLIVPEESIPDGYTLDDIASQWSRFNGVIPVRTRNGALLPQQVSANAVNIGISELLNTQLGLMEDISGVTGALQGKMASAGMSGKLYEQQARNATLSQLDLLDTFYGFLREACQKDISNLRQFGGERVGQTSLAGGDSVM